MRWKPLAAGMAAALAATHAAAQAYAPPDPQLVPVDPEERLHILRVFMDGDPVVKLVLAGLLVAAIAALVLWILQASRRTAAPRSMTFLAVWSRSAVLVGLFGASYTLMNSAIGLSNLRPAPSIGVVAPGLAEALLSVMLGLLGAAIATMGHRHLQARLVRPVEVEDAAEAGPRATVRLAHEAG
ncbi:MotA/TolQ/ExbB proton channel family protein [Phenylobacterium sp.]|jgi:biopolymer transport protein ExbB/TolQ|uniref:MotA/TolQ/ExbB proton channel family protein n=1 Tax=Phenylobacterium sp. TaxID=1871053 RepID=UPI002F92889B